MMVGVCTEGTAPELPGWLAPVTGQEKTSSGHLWLEQLYKLLAGFELKVAR